MHTQTGRELTRDEHYALVLSSSTNYDSKFNTMSSETSRRICETKTCDSNFDQDPPSEVTEDFDCYVDTSATALIAHMAN